MRLGFLLCASAFILSTAYLLAEDDFPTPINNEADKLAEPMSAAEAAKSFSLPDGFNVNVFAAEPEVQNPIALTWDGRGRIWVAENFTYSSRDERFDLSLRDRVLIFEDSNHDGVADKRTVFTDQVQMLTSVEVGLGGVWLMCPPQLLFIPDVNHDDVADGPAQVMLDGFDVARDNYHNFANGLKFGPDGWLYGRCGGSCPGRIGVPGTEPDQRLALEGGIWRYHPLKKSVEVLTHGTTNPWGMDWNAVGEAFFTNTVNGHLWHMIPGAHLDRPFTLDPNPLTFELMQMTADHWHFDTGKSWNQSRDGVANSYGGGHAHCGAMIYQGDNWPEQYRGKLFTLNFHGRRINQENFERKGSGYVAHHGEDMLLAADPFFRGMDLSYGPDGAVYILDWSDTGECHEATGVHRTSGRIYRVAYGPTTELMRDTPVDIAKMSNDELVQQVYAQNEWFCRQARLELSHRSSTGADLSNVAQSLNRILKESSTVETYRALMMLRAIDAVDYDLLEGLYELSGDENIRAWVVRLLVDDWPIDDCMGRPQFYDATSVQTHPEYMQRFSLLQSIAARDRSEFVQLTLLSAAQRLPLSDRLSLIRPMITQAAHSMDRKFATDDASLPLMFWYAVMAITPEEDDSLVDVILTQPYLLPQRFMARRLAQQVDAYPGAIDELLSKLTQSAAVDSAVTLNILQGIDNGLRGLRSVKRPAAWPELFKKLDNNDDTKVQTIAIRLNSLFGGKIDVAQAAALISDSSISIELRRTTLENIVRSRVDGLVPICLSVLNDPHVNTIALEGLAGQDDLVTGTTIVENYSRFRSPERSKVITVLTSRANFVIALLNGIESKRIPVVDLTAYDVRQIYALENQELIDRVGKLWGNIQTTTAAKQEKIATLKNDLSTQVLAVADRSHGRALFTKNCSQCHRLFGQGGMIGPELTGANRNNLDYLLENIIDPSAVVSKDYRMSIVMTNDDRLISGLIVTKNENTLTLQTQTELIYLANDDIEKVKQTTQSPMPDGLLDTLTPEETRDLFSYLQSPTQVESP